MICFWCFHHPELHVNIDIMLDGIRVNFIKWLSVISFIQPSFSGYFLCHQIKVISVQLLLVIILLFRKPRDNLCLPPYSLSIMNSVSYRAFATYLIKRKNLIPSTCTGSGISSVTKLSNRGPTLSLPCVIRLRLDCRHIAQRKKVNRYFVR